MVSISVISWQSVLLVEEIRVPGENHKPVQASTLTYFSTCPFGQLTKKSTCPAQYFSCPKKLKKIVESGVKHHKPT
jgi:hypothetical protein